MDKEGLSKLLDALAKAVALLAILIMVVIIAHNIVAFIPENVYTVLLLIQTYAGMTLIGLVGLEAVANKPLPFKIVVIALIAVIVIANFFPAVQEKLVAMISKK